MYSTSSQKRFWTFENEEELSKFRFYANRNYVIKNKTPEEESNSVFFLSTDEELIIVRHYEKVMKDFLVGFMPRHEPLPKEVKGTAFHFYKRFFVVSSVMDYHPKEVMITCIYLSCKICEYYLPIDIFVKNIEENPRLLRDIILDQELELLYRLNFKLNIHTPYRAIDGLLLDLRTRSHFQKPERLYEHINRFLSGMWFTDVCLLYSPPLIALAAIMHATSRCKENIDKFIMSTFLNCPPAATMNNIIQTVREIRSKVMNLKDLPSREEIAQLESRLALCRNPQNDPTSGVFKRRMMEKALEAHRQ